MSPQPPPDAGVRSTLQSPLRSARRNALRAPTDDDISRRRAMSELVRSDLSPGRWRIVAAWSSLRRSRDIRRPEASHVDANTDDMVDAVAAPAASSAAPPAVPSRILSERRDSTLSALQETSTGDVPDGEPDWRPRKRVSLFLRRRRTVRADGRGEGEGDSDGEAPGESDALREGDGQRGMDAIEQGASASFRRARSHILAPVSGGEAGGGEGRRYLEYAAEIDENSLERLRDFTKSLRGFVRPGAIRIVKEERDANSDGDDGECEEGTGSDEIIGEICLEDFADVGSEDFDFLEEQSVDLSSLEPSSIGRMSRLPSLKLDNQKLRWIGNEAEFAAFFAEVGLDDWFEVEGPVDRKHFDVGEELAAEWVQAGLEHNERCALWADSTPPADCSNTSLDIRELDSVFGHVLRRRDIREGWQRRVRMNP